MCNVEFVPKPYTNGRVMDIFSNERAIGAYVDGPFPLEAASFLSSNFFAM